MIIKLNKLALQALKALNAVTLNHIAVHCPLCAVAFMVEVQQQ